MAVSQKPRQLKPPAPWHGGKRRVAPQIWRRLGDVKNYVEPFAGMLAVLLNRPTAPGIETINDLDCYVANFWRAVTFDPEATAWWASYPVSEVDLHARHDWLVAQDGFRSRMDTDEDYYDVQIAGWWIWGLSCWIGGGWCSQTTWRIMPALSGPGMGVHRTATQVPHLSNSSTGTHRTNRARPQLSRAGRGVDPGILTTFDELCTRLRRVRICCGDWIRVLGPCVTTGLGLTGIFLDPPYGPARDDRLYAVDDTDVYREVGQWAREHGDDPKMRIVLCGYEDEHDMPGWDIERWTTAGGYGKPRQECIWYSPHCLKVARQKTLFGGFE